MTQAAGQAQAGTPEAHEPAQSASEAQNAGEAPEVDGVAALGYEQARDELAAIVARLEAGQVGIEESMALWERGEALATHCARWLDRAEARLSGQQSPQGAATQGG